ncbi:YiiX/YebB-like N1pC/P60 family cysteine hydrolase [Legionella sainthelensi]|uniref:YiiX/YebB-like N1pC/P60 family cysteine hydrolase n=1 Tax=Legionella sainthelensi TaxID=28087 RepID=UPI00216592CB|nr:YiiX/YebB-like N1pC/P60 family cysteine hydrolase [Legionella sainthelensi]
MDGFSQETFPNVNTNNYDQIRDTIKTGDLLFASGNSLMSSMIKGATNSVWSHVAFIVRLEAIDRIMIMESVETVGVRTVALSNYVRNYNGSGQGYPGKIMLARYQDFPINSFSNLSKQAVDLLGYPYNTEEVLRIAARIGMNAFGFDKTSPESFLPMHLFVQNMYILAINLLELL